MNIGNNISAHFMLIQFVLVLISLTRSLSDLATVASNGS